MSSPILTVRDLKTYFSVRGDVIRAVDDVNLTMEQGEILGLVGESGCGKTVTALSIMRLILTPGRIVQGSAFYKGKNLFDLSYDEMRAIRGDRISMIFQDPMTCLNPVYRVGEQIEEAIFLHRDLSDKLVKAKALDLLTKVGISDYARRFNDYPHEFSGGMRQRVMIAMAMACDPDILIADEPVTALDVTVQAQILELLKTMRERFHTSILMITHDMGVVAETCDRVCVMYAGKIVEEAPVIDLFKSPSHPYTKGLMSCIPRADIKIDRLYTIKGGVPDLTAGGEGCRFAPRCDLAIAKCREKTPVLKEIKEGHYVACFMSEGF
jgi:oligopeptide/dipeptide ABC transporter ATP-binding protein